MSAATGLTLPACLKLAAGDARAGFRLANAYLACDLYFVDSRWFDHGILATIDRTLAGRLGPWQDQIRLCWAASPNWEVVAIEGADWEAVAAGYLNPESPCRVRRSERSRRERSRRGRNKET